MRVLLLVAVLFATGCGYLPGTLAETTNPVRPHWSDHPPAPGCARGSARYRGLAGIARKTAIARAKAALAPRGGTITLRRPRIRIVRQTQGYLAEVCERPKAK